MTTQVSHGFRIETAEDVKRIVQPHPDVKGQVPDSESHDERTLCGVPVTKRGVLLTSEECRLLREWAADNVRFGVLVLNVETCKAILQLEVVDPKQVAPWFKVGDEWFSAKSNTTNRKLVEARLGSDTKPGYAHDMLQGLWGFADPALIDALALILSLQHRCAAYLRANSIDPDTPPIEIPVLLYVPPQFADFIDRGKVRTPQDMEYRDSTNFTDELLAEVLAEVPAPQDLPKAKTLWTKTLVSASNNIFVRAKGVDVHPSKGQAPSEGDRIRVQSRFPDYYDLQRLILIVDSYSRGDDDKPSSWVKTWNHNLLTTALVLRCNANHSDPDNLTIDFDYCREVLAALRESSSENGSGPFGPALQDVANATSQIKKAGGSRPNDKELFGCLVAAIGQFDESGSTDKVWQGKRDRKKAKAEKTFRIFGGVDCGPVADEDE